MRVLLFILFSVIVSSASAADSVIVRKDARMDLLSIKHYQANQRNAMMLPNGLYKGYRIQLLSTSKRDDAFGLRTSLLAQFPDHKTYVVYQSPSFKVRMGNFLKKEEAEKLKAQLNKIFPNGVYIVEDSIEYTFKEDEDIITP